MLLKKYAIAALAVISVSIVWYFATTDFATHSDVFWYGVIAGFLALLLLLCLGLMAVFVYQLTRNRLKPSGERVQISRLLFE